MFGFGFDRMVDKLQVANPAQILGANLYDWFDFTDSSTLSLTGVRVNSITSKASARQFTSSGTDRPQIVTNQINGLQVARFDGISEFMSVPASTALYNFLHNQANGGMVIIVNKITDADSNALYALLNNNNAGTTTIGIYILYDDRVAQLRNNTISVAISRTGGILNTAGTQFVDNIFPTQQYNSLIQIFNPNNATASERLNTIVNNGGDNKLNTASMLASNSNATSNMTLGKNSGASNVFLKGDMVEIIISQNQPTPTQLTQLQTYLTSKYGTFPIV